MAGTLGQNATDRVFMEDANGISRLVAAPGDPVPNVVPPMGIVTTPVPPEAALEPFDGYDTLTEADVVARLDGLSDEQLAAVRAYEQAHQARGSITRYGLRSTVVTGTRRLRTVPAESTSEGYDAMTVPDLQAEADRRGLQVTGTGADGNVVKADLVKALQADDAKEPAGEGYDAMTVDELQAEADRRGLQVTGTGADGNVLKGDLVAALEAADASA